MSAASAKTQEPSMDEILASIRRIIADDQDAVKAESAPADVTAEPFPDPIEGDHSPRVVLSVHPSDEDDEVSFEPMSEPETDIAQGGPSPVRRLAQVMAASPTPAEPPRPVDPLPIEPRDPHDGAPTLVSSETTASVNNAFNMLSHTVLTQNARTLEDLVKDMLKPMLKTWLDDNLPPLVERLVRAEIERVSRGRR